VMITELVPFNSRIVKWNFHDFVVPIDLECHKKKN